MRPKIAMILFPLAASSAFAAPLFSGHGTLKANPPAPILREVNASVDFALLDQLKSGAVTSATLNLFGDVLKEISISSVVEKGADHHELTASVVGSSDSYVYLATKENYIIGYIEDGSSKTYDIEFDYDSGSGYTIAEVDLNSTIGPYCATVPNSVSTTCDDGYSDDCTECIGPEAQQPVTVDVMVAYSQQFNARHLGIDSLIELYFDRAFNQANRIYARSGALARLSRVATVNSGYDEGPLFARDAELKAQLCDLFNGNQGLAKLRVTRDAARADFIVFYIVGNPLSLIAAGKASAIGARDINAMCVIAPYWIGRLAKRFLLAHEAGHLFGLGHTNTNSGLTEYGQGYHFGPLEVLPGNYAMFQTIMFGTDIALPFSRFSNPEQSFLIWQTGDEQIGDETRLINETVRHIANLRTEDVGKFEIRDANGLILAQFLDTGNVLIKGSLSENESFVSLNNTGSSADFRVVNPSGNTVARLDATSGSLRLANTVLINQGLIYESQTSCMVFRRNDGKIVATIDNSGQMKVHELLIEENNDYWF